MQKITLAAVGLTAASLCAMAVLTPAAPQEDATPVFVKEIPHGYRDWRLISVAHEEGSLNDIRAILGDDVAIKAYREDRLPFPDGAIIARIAWKYVPSEENNKVFGRSQSFVAGSAQLGTSSLWSRTQKSTPRRVAGGSLNLIRTANPPSRLCSKPAFPATKQSKIVTSSSPITRLNTESREESIDTITIQLKT